MELNEFTSIPPAVIKYLDMFSGIGGFKLAFDNAGFKSIGFCEIDSNSRSLYKEYFDTNKELEIHDATKIKPDELPDFDIFVGGFPCQAFSIAGKRQGFEGSRGSLIFDIIRICKEKRPRYIVLEKVKGLLSHNEGQTFQSIIGLLTSIGYRVEWQILNSKDFGVPQNRERVFIVGHYGGNDRSQIFPIREADKIYYQPRKNQEKIGDITYGGSISNIAQTLKYSDDQWGGNFVVFPLTEVRSDEAKEIRKNNRKETGKDYSPRRKKEIDIKENGLVGTLTGTITPEQHIIEITNNVPQGYRVYDPDGIGCCLQSTSGGVGAKTGLYCVAVRGRKQNGKYEQTAEIRNDGITNSLTSFQKDNYVTNGYSIRRLTPLECFRLQGFPDEMVEVARKLNLSDNKLYKMAGNAVTVQVVETIARKIMKQIQEQDNA